VNVVVFVGLFYLFNCRSLIDSPFTLGFFSNPWAFAGAGALIIAQILFTYVPFMNDLLASAPISAADWALIVAAGLASYVVVETEKWVRRRSVRR
jgi:cation-transporting P-type ATPase F